VNNAASAAMTVPWVFSINSGTFNFGAVASAPTLTTTTPNNTPQDNLVGNVSGGSGTFNMINGTLTSSARFDTALVGTSTGIVNQVGGTMNMGSQFQGANGQNAGEVSTVDISGGTMSINAGSGQFFVASRDTGTLNMNGGTLNCGTLDVSRNAYGNTIGSVGVVNLNGGTILCSVVATATANAQTGTSGASATFNFNGGTLELNSSTPPFFQGSTVAPVIPISAIVRSGGAFINSNGKTNIFAEPLLHDSTLGSVPDGGLTKNGSGCLVLVSNVSYTGNTTVNAGTLALSNSVALNSSPVLTIAGGATLDASGRSDDTLTLVSGQTLTGSGVLKGNVMVGNGATLAPGSSVGALTFSNNLALTGGSLTTLALNATLLTNEVVQVAGTLTYGGTLALTNVSGTLANGESFKLFRAANASGGFTNITPALPGLNLAWNTNNLAVNGTLGVMAQATASPKIGALTFSGSDLILSGSNGVADWTYYVLATTNLALPLADWTMVSTNTFDGSGNFNLTNFASPASSQNFYLLKLQ